MAPFYPIYLARSDGKVVYGTEKNEPLPHQLDQKPNAQGICDFYRLCDPGDVKEVDWRRKLGGMLAREKGNKEMKDKNFILAALPEGYRLYEHVKCKLKNGEPEPTKVKNHAAGSNERQDAYLYGYPGGRRKRYRSPAEFFPHLLWLGTDVEGDPDNCSCKFCAPEELSADVQAKIDARQVKSDAKAKLDPGPTASTTATLPIANSRPTGAAAPSTLQLTPSPLPPFKSPEHKDDATFDKYLYRVGETTWFSRGNAWGLGLIVKREISLGKQLYRIQPLSHPFNQPGQVTCPLDGLRPWLAWSPPPCTHAALNPTKDRPRESHYDGVDWRTVIDGKLGQGDAEVDGSILAAKRAETTFTPFAPAGVSSNGEARYHGIFIGGEKIWVGDALRIRNFAAQTEALILVLLDIIESPNMKDPSRPTITFIGDKYSYKIVQLESNPPVRPEDDLHLPSRVREDLSRRNRITFASTDPNRKFTSFWKLVGKDQRLSMSEIKGRWWETTLLYPILQSREYDAQKQKGESKDVTLCMNGQGDCNRPFGSQPGSMTGFMPAYVKCNRREEAFGAAIPRELRLSVGSGLANSPPASSHQSRIGAFNGASDQSGPQSTIHGQNHLVTSPPNGQIYPQSLISNSDNNHKYHNAPQYHQSQGALPQASGFLRQSDQTYGSGLASQQYLSNPHQYNYLSNDQGNSAFEQFMNYDTSARHQ